MGLRYFRSTITYLKRHGKPVAFYSDKHRSSASTPSRSKGMSQFGRALAALNIDITARIHTRRRDASTG